MQREEVPFKIALRLQRGHSLRESRNPFASNVTVLRVEFSPPELAEALWIMLQPFSVDPSRLLFRLGRNIYEAARPRETRAEKTFCLPTKLILRRELTYDYEASYQRFLMFVCLIPTLRIILTYLLRIYRMQSRLKFF